MSSQGALGLNLLMHSAMWYAAFCTPTASNSKSRAMASARPSRLAGGGGGSGSCGSLTSSVGRCLWGDEEVLEEGEEGDICKKVARLDQ